MTFRFIADNADPCPVTWMCEALEVSVRGYCAWGARADSPTEVWRRALADAIAEVPAQVKGATGPS